MLAYTEVTVWPRGPIYFRKYSSAQVIAIVKLKRVCKAPCETVHGWALWYAVQFK